MKKIPFALLCIAICCSLFCSCMGDFNINKTEGAPNSSAEGTESETFPVRMIRAGGSLYYDSGLFSDNTPRCGTMDGNLKKGVGELEIPQNDGETNFDIKSQYFGYQNATKITKEIPLDEGWAIFKKIDSYGRDITQYKYCFGIKGRHPNAEKKSEYLVFSNTTEITFEQITKYFFGAKREDQLLDIFVVHTEILDEWGITLWAENPSPHKVTVFCEQFGGAPEGELHCGSSYTLEVWKNEKWVKQEYKTENEPVWNDIAYLIPKNDVIKWEIDFEFIYESLRKGRYRIGKSIMDYKGASGFEEKTYYAEFTIQ